MAVSITDADQLQEIYRRDGRRVFATLVRLLGSFDLAEEALHDAFIAAASAGRRREYRSNPVAWLVSAGRFKAIDQCAAKRVMTSLERRRRTGRRNPG